jgi:hypothetical protein
MLLTPSERKRHGATLGVGDGDEDVDDDDDDDGVDAGAATDGDGNVAALMYSVCRLVINC